MTSYIEWAGDEAIVYITMDEILRPDKVQGLTWSCMLETLKDGDT